MRVAEVMTTVVVTVPPSAPFKRVAELMLRHGIGAVPVVDPEGAVIGIVTDADLLPKEAVDPPPWALRPPLDFRWDENGATWYKAQSLTAGELMSAPVRTTAPDADLRATARLMIAEGLRRLPVVEGRRLVGIVTRTDLLKVFVREDAAIGASVERVLADCGFNPPEHDIEVTVDAGVVVLRGLTTHLRDVGAISALVAGVEGVVAVENLLGFTRVDREPAPAGTRPKADRAIEERTERKQARP